MGCNIDVWYLAHTGFAVDLGHIFLIFDYYLDTCGEPRSLSSGVIVPDELQDKKVCIFSSHRHPDHFNPVILSWKEKLPHAEYFLSSDIPKKYHQNWVHILKANELYEENDLQIHTFKSTDEGVAFLVTLHGLNIYHAGDLNWWHWNDEPVDRNNDMAARFKHEVDQVKDFPVDIAFLTADPRQESAELWGLTYFLEHVDVKKAFPMHFWDDFSVMERISANTACHPQLKKVKTISARGQHFNLEL